MRGLIAAVAVLWLVAGCGDADVASPSSSSSSVEATDSSPVEIPPQPNVGGVSCASIGGQFVPHGTDGRGDCMSADASPACHLRPDEQPSDGNYVAEITMTPPFSYGSIDLTTTRVMLAQADNPQCWHLPAA